MEPEEIRLQRMGLSKLSEADSFLDHEDEWEADVLIIGATVKNPNRLSTNKSKTITAEYTWAMEEAAEWCKEYITFDEVKAKGVMMPLKIASDPETYAVSDYFEYLPLHVINAEEKYKKNLLRQTHLRSRRIENGGHQHNIYGI